MKILLHGNSPRSNTGYGVQIALLAARLADDGHDVVVSCTHGQQTGMGAWKTPSGKTIRLYPTDDKSVGGHTIIHGHANHFFEGDPQAGWIIPLIDVPTLTPNSYLPEYKVAAWAPVDHITVPSAVLEFFDRSKALCVCMSRHAESEYLRAGLDPTYIPLAVDTKAYKPSPFVTIEATGQTVTAREFYGLEPNTFGVGMVAMNKGNVFDRKGFSEAFYAFGQFRRNHPNSVLFVHSDWTGYTGINLHRLAKFAGIPEDGIVFSDQYAYVHGFPPAQMAAMYTAMDVLLAPSHGEGFCVPLIEAQACGVPVIASAATAQTELVGLGAGWLVKGQPQWDAPSDCPAFLPFIHDIIDALEQAYAEEDIVGMGNLAREFAAGFDADRVFDEYWRPFLESLEPPVPEANKPAMERVAVVVPAMRPEHVQPFVDAFDATNDGTAELYFVVDPDNEELAREVDKAGLVVLVSDRGGTFAQKANYAYANTDEDWIFLTGEDTRFTPGWLDKPRELSTRYDVIGTNDAPEGGPPKNKDVAAGRHADHWFTRRSYIDDEGASLEGPGQFCPERYFHWHTDKEVIELAKARGVFTPCLDSHVIHLHPGYDGDEEARQNDPVYMKAVEWAERDFQKWTQVQPLLAQQRAGRR